jgi:hypothetical protein
LPPENALVSIFNVISSASTSSEIVISQFNQVTGEEIQIPPEANTPWKIVIHSSAS